MILLHEKYKVITLQWLYQLNLIDLCTTQLIDVKAIAINWFIAKLYGYHKRIRVNAKIPD